MPTLREIVPAGTGETPENRHAGVGEVELPDRVESAVRVPRALRDRGQLVLARDVAVVVLVTVAAALLSVHFELSEAVLAWTRPREYFQLDELPGVLLVLATCLVWFAWRRYREARSELGRRRGAELDLAAALADNRVLAQHYVRIWDSEQKNLARELHDELGQYLNAIKLDATSIRDRARAPSPAIEDAALAIIESTNHVHAVVSDMIRRLRPVGLDDLGLAAALEHCVGRWRERLRTTSFVLSIDENVDDLGESLNLTIYRLAQEALTNVSKHARAARVQIQLARVAQRPGEPDEITFSLADDGMGTNLDRRSGGLGVRGMRERVEALGGHFSISSAPGQGFRLVARLPVRPLQSNIG